MHFPAKLRFQTSLSFMRNSMMGAAFLMMQSPTTSSDFLFLFFRFPSSPGVGVSLGIGFFGRGLDKIGGKDHIEGAAEYHLMNFVKSNEVVIDH